jgi:hypothetical protein
MTTPPGASEVEFVDLAEFDAVGVGVLDDVVQLTQVGLEVAAGVAGGRVGVIGVDLVGAGDRVCAMEAQCYIPRAAGRDGR